jgi:hypothetical protein
MEMGIVFLCNATFNNSSVISWQSILLVEETGVHRENHWLVASHWQTLSLYVVSSTPRLRGVRTDNISGDRYWLEVVGNPTTIRSWPWRPHHGNNPRWTLNTILTCFSFFSGIPHAVIKIKLLQCICQDLLSLSHFFTQQINV